LATFEKGGKRGDLGETALWGGGKPKRAGRVCKDKRYKTTAKARGTKQKNKKKKIVETNE